MPTLNAKKLKNKYSWYIDYGFIKGKRHRESLNLYTKKKYGIRSKVLPEDKEIWVEILNKFNNAKLPKTTQKRANYKNFNEFLFELSKSERPSYKNVYNHFNRFSPNHNFDLLDFITLESFQDYLKDQELSKGSIIEYMKTSQAAIKKAKKRGLIDKNKSFEIDKRLKEVEPDPIYLTEEEVIKIDNYPSDDFEEGTVRNAFVFCCFVGLRFSDIAKLKFSDVDKVKNRIRYQMKKGDKLKYAYLSETALNIIEEQRVFNFFDLNQNVPADFIFPLPSLKKYNEIILRIAQMLGINKHVTSHTGRHTFAITYFLPYNNNDLYGLQIQLGHDSILTTQKYYGRVLDSSRIKSMNNLPKL